MLGLGIGLTNLGIKGGIADAADGGVSAAALFLATYGPCGMVLDFEDASIEIDDAADLLDFRSSGQVSNGALVGPGALLSYPAPSVKLTEQADGSIGFQAHNLFLWSEDFSQATWTKSNCTATAGEITVANAGNLPKYVQQAGLTASAFDWRGSFEFKQVSGIRYIQVLKLGSVNNYVNFDLQAGAVGAAGSACVGSIEPLSDGYYRCTVDVTNATTHSDSWRIQIVNSTTAAYNAPSTASGSVLVRKAHFRRQNSWPDYIATTTAAAYDLPYVYSGGVRQGVSVELAATNALQWSNDLSRGTWNRSNATVVQNATGPDGVVNSASTLTPTTSSGFVFQGSVSVASTAAIFSVWLRSTGGNVSTRLGVNATGANPNPQQLDITVTSSWQRFTFPISVVSGTPFNVIIGNLFGSWSSLTPIEVWGAQLETGTVATSPIITYGSTVLRASDTPNALLNLFPAIGSAYTIYAKYKPQSASVATTAIRLDDTTANELVSLGNDASGQGAATVTDGGAPQTDPLTTGTITSAAYHRVAASVEGNNVRLVVNGGAEVQDTSVTLPTLTRLLIGSGGGMELVQLAILPGARTEAQLQALGA